MTVLDATLGGPAANSYIDVATADDLVPLVVSKDRSTAWLAQTPEDKAVFLIRATKMLEAYIDFDGQRTIYDQRLSWPRNWVYGPDRVIAYQSTELPVPVQEAQAMLAVNLSEGFDQDAAGDSPIQRLQISSLRVYFNTDQAARSSILIPSEVIEKLRGFGDYAGASGLARSIQLSRAG